MKTAKKILILSLISFSFFASCSSNSLSYLFSTPGANDSYCLVEFDSDGGTYVEPQKVEYGKTAFEPEAPSKELGYFEYEFGGWYLGDKPFDFNTPIESTTYLKAKWNGTPPAKDAYHFKFTGTNCLVNNLATFEMDIKTYAPAQFIITPKDSTYGLPSAISIEGAGKEKATYSPKTGVISISQMVGDITITATAVSAYQFSFTGTNCKIGDSNPYQVQIERGEQQLQFTIRPDPLYDVPEEIEIVKGENVSYENGVITISEVTSDVTIKATSRHSYDSISFNGIHCKADIDPSGTNADYNFIAKKYSDQDSLTLHLFPDDGYQLPVPGTIRVSFFKADDSYSNVNEEDYIYDRTNKTLTINKDDYDAVVSLTATPIGENHHMVTIDANGGVFFEGLSKFEIQVNDGDNLSNLLRNISVPTLDGSLFGYYTIVGSSEKIGYDSTVNEDLNLKAYYFPTSTPYDNLDDRASWEQIKQVAATNSDPHVCFKIGATKTFEDKKHIARIIGMNHDTITGGTKKAAFTFEFTTAISKSDGTAYTCEWDKREGSESKNYDFINSTLNTFITETLLPWVNSTRVGPYLEKVDKASGRNGTIYYPYLFPLAYVEMMNYDDDEPSPTAEGEKYEYYKIYTTRSDRIKKNTKNNAVDYWLRSPETEYSYNAWAILDNGATLNSLIYYEPFAIAPAFCL